MKKILYAIFILFSHFLLFSINNNSNEIFFREDFVNLIHWDNFCLPGVKCEKKYDLGKDSNKSFLKIDTDSSVTGLICAKIFNPYEFPIVRWNWKVDNIFQKGDGEKRKSDDYPIRIFVLFEVEYSNEEKFKNIFYNIIKNSYGLSLPHSALVFVWESKIKNKKYIICPYSKIIRYIPLQMGKNNIGKWKEEKINIIDNYKLAFNELPPKKAVIAIMADSDNTKEKSTAYIDFIEISK